MAPHSNRLFAHRFAAAIVSFVALATTLGCAAGDATKTISIESGNGDFSIGYHAVASETDAPSSTTSGADSSAVELTPPLSNAEVARRSAALADLVEARKASILARYLEDPFPSPDSNVDSERCWGRAGFALAAYRKGSEIARADRYLREIHEAYGFRASGPADASPCYFAMPLLLRIFFDPAVRPHLSEEARNLLLDSMHRFVRERSRVEAAQASTWRIAMSENHDAIQKATYLLASRALMQAHAPYGPQLELADGNTVAAHYTAWLEFWQRYFRDRAREGIGCEIASPVYAKHSLASYYGVRDFAGDDALQTRADDFLTLYWADVAQDFLPEVGIRGGAETRAYKNAYLTTGSRQSTHAWSFLYGWHDNEILSVHPLTLVAASSSYSPGPLVREQAIDRTASYLYVSRRCGRGSMRRVDGEPHYRMRFDDGRGSHLVRTSFVTADYVIGALTFDPDEPYNALVGQNRTMGVVFSSAVDDRIVVHGRGLDKHGTVGFDEITGMVAPDVLMVARDPRARRTAGTRIFVSNGALWDNRVEYAGWLFSHAGDAYVGIRMAEAGYVVRDDPRGKMLDQRDSWTPIVIQLGRAADYESFDAFQGEVASNPYLQTRTEGEITRRGLTSDDYAQVLSRVRYRSEAGDVLTFYSHNRRRPQINGASMNLLPALAYDSPYIETRYRTDTVTLRHPQYGQRVLDFSL